MNRALIIVILINVLCCVWILFETPFIKIPTEQALKAIERGFVRDDLSADARRDLDSFTDRIAGNQTATENSLTSVRFLGLAIGTILLVQNVVLLTKLGRINKKHNKARLGNPLPRTETEIEF